MTKICIPIAENTTEKVIQKIRESEKIADVIEVWLGELPLDKGTSSENHSGIKGRGDLEEIRNATMTPLLANCKPLKEKGNFLGNEKDRFDILLEAAQHGFEYVDFDYEFPEELIKSFKKQKPKDCELILSAHYFDGTPGLPHLTHKLQAIQKQKPNMVKFAATPKNLKDVVTMIRLAEKLESKKIPHIVISMGALGKVTRLASPLLGNEMMFTTIDEASATAPGQVSAEKLRESFCEYG